MNNKNENLIVYQDSNNDSELDVYRNDNSFNNQGVDSEYNNYQGQVSQPGSGGNLLNTAHDFAAGAKEGFKSGLNPEKNNPALGVGRGNNKNSNKSGKKDNNGNKTPAKGQKDKPKKRNPLPGGVDRTPDNKKPGSGDKPKDENKNGKNGNTKNTGLASKLNPMTRRKHMLGGFGRQAGTKKAGSSKISQVIFEGLKKLWMAVPIQIKIIIILGIPALLLLIAILVAIFGGTTGGVIAASCGETEYSVDGSDVTSFLCGMQDPVKDSNYSVSSLFGWRAYNPSRMHKGIDLAGESGTPILAVYDGEVVEIQTGQCYECGSGYGNYVIIEHNETFTTLYAHLLEVDVKVGQSVKQGDTIGKRGSTGGSDGEHLHFEIRKDGKQVSPNPFFGYSDEGYEKCIDDSKGYQDNCDLDSSGSARYVGEDGVSQICGRTGNYSNSGNDRCCNTDSAGGSIQDFINVFEGSGDYCDPAKTLYKAYQNAGDRVTIGHGVTSDYIPDLKIGDCRSVSEVDAAQLKAIENKRNNIRDIFSGVSLSAFQEDAMTSMAFNGCGDFFSDIAKAAADDNYEEVWNAMKGCTNGGMLGLERRRKAEFALYVTGDYSVAESYKTKSWTAAEYDDFDSENVIAKKATGTSSVCVTSSGDKSAVVERALQEYDNWHSSSSNSHYCSNIEKYLASCGYNGGKGGRDNYCAGFATYILKEAGVADVIGLPNYSCIVSNFKNTTNGTVHKAGGSYVPEPGDLMITNGWGHIVIVEKVEGQRVHYIGGNEGGSGFCGYGKVNKGSFDLSSGTISAYISY